MKKLFIVGKRYTEEYIRKCIDTHPDIFTDAYYFDYSQYITHSKDWVLRDKTDFKQLTLQNINIPKDTFLMYAFLSSYPLASRRSLVHFFIYLPHKTALLSSLQTAPIVSVQKSSAYIWLVRSK